MISSYFLAFLCRISSTGPNNRLNECLSKETHFKELRAITLAALGCPLSKDNSPK